MSEATITPVRPRRGRPPKVKEPSTQVDEAQDRKDWTSKIRGDKSFTVTPLGRAAEDLGLQPHQVDGCCDESEAVRHYCVVTGHTSSKSRFRVEPV